jgi:hypothetical protein
VSDEFDNSAGSLSNRQAVNEQELDENKSELAEIMIPITFKMVLMKE